MSIPIKKERYFYIVSRQEETRLKFKEKIIMTIENEIKEILKELPNENSRLDYKQIEYTKEKKTNLLKISLLC